MLRRWPGGLEADIESATPHAAVACPEADQEPSAVRWSEVAPRCVSRISSPHGSCGLTVPQANMQVITAIYLNCRQDLRDEWLTGLEVDDVYDAQVCCGMS